jgi:predicted MarR family transcription regulator
MPQDVQCSPRKHTTNEEGYLIQTDLEHEAITTSHAKAQVELLLTTDPAFFRCLVACMCDCGSLDRTAPQSLSYSSGLLWNKINT